MLRNWCRLAALLALLLFAAAGAQAAEDQVEPKSAASEEKSQSQPTKVETAERQQALDTENKSWSNIKALWG
jgi:hypothetical protein